MSIDSGPIDSKQIIGVEIDVGGAVLGIVDVVVVLVLSLMALAFLRKLPCLLEANRKLLTDRCHLNVSPVVLCWNKCLFVQPPPLPPAPLPSFVRLRLQ